MDIILLSPTDRKFELATHKIVITYADLAGESAATTATFSLPESGTFPAGTVARFAGLKLVTAFDFSDAGITSCTLEVGDGTDPNRLLVATELAVDGTEILWYVEGAVTQPYAYAVADTIDFLFTVANGGSPLVTETTAGEVHVYLYLHAPGNTLENVNSILV